MGILKLREEGLHSFSERRMDQTGGKLCEGKENEAALGQSWVWYGEALLPDDLIPVEKDVKVQGPWPAGCCSDPSLVLFDLKAMHE